MTGEGKKQECAGVQGQGGTQTGVKCSHLFEFLITDCRLLFLMEAFDVPVINSH